MLAKTYKNCVDIDDYWNKSGEVEKKILNDLDKAYRKNNKSKIEELEQECMKQKATNLISGLSSSHLRPEVILCQSEIQWDILCDSYLKDSLKCLICVPVESFHTDLIRKSRKDAYYAQNCSNQRLALLKCKVQPIQYYRDFSELFSVINKQQPLRLK